MTTDFIGEDAVGVMVGRLLRGEDPMNTVGRVAVAG